MSQDWYYKLLGEEAGPITFLALRELAQEGHLASNDEVRTSNSRWKLAEQVPGLFGAEVSEEPELATDMDLDLLLAPSSSQPVKVSQKRQGQLAALAAAAAPVAQWYYKLLGQDMGPSSTDEIIQQIKDGSLHGADLACHGEHGIWQPLENTPEFSAIVLEMRPKPEWYCQVLGQEFGPMIFEELQQMAKAGALNTDDEVRHGEGAPWVKADRVRGLKFPKSSTTADAPAHDRTSTLVPFGEAAKKREWYYEIVGQQMGPVSFTEMAKFVSSGTLKLEDKARRGKSGLWTLVMDVPGLVTTEDKSAYLAAKIEASRPKPLPPSPVAAAPASPTSVAIAPQRVEPQPSAEAAPPPRPLPDSTSSVSSYGASGSASGYGSMASTSRTGIPPRPPAFTPPKKSGGSSSGLGSMLADLKDKLDPKAMGAIAVILLIGMYFAAAQFGFSLSFGPPPGAKEFKEVNALWVEVQGIHKKGDTPADWKAFKTKHESEIKKLMASVEKQKPGSDRPLLQVLLFCTKNHLPKMMEGNPTTIKARYKLMEKDMKRAKEILGVK